MASINYERNRRYFTPVSYKPGIICIVVGVLLLFFGSAGPILIGLALAALGGFLIYRQAADRPTDEQLDRQVREILAGLKPQALDKLGLDADEVSLIPPIVVGGNSFSGRVKKGKDGVFRSSTCEGIVIFFGEQELHSYKYQVSLIEDQRSREETDVYFYRDVVSVATKSDTVQVAVEGVGQQQIQLERFKLTTSGATTIECSMDATSNTTGRDIQGAKTLIRNKKMLAT
ncbi:hypothetical protein [Kribbella lupini]|uniref:Uncharacterized protein n=1 Tax=Kribbella lupini TaxID=291602 RepID=A0ABN2BTL1_9ACTN